MSNKPHIEQVRAALLATLEDLRDKNNPMDIERAKAVALVSGVLVDTARVENDYLKITDQVHSDFLAPATDAVPRIAQADAPSAHNPFPTSTVHRLQG